MSTTMTPDADHDHPHEHPHDHEPGYTPGAEAGVAVEVGPGLGALLIHPGERFRGLEIEISPAGDPAAPRVHTGVHERRTLTSSALTAIFGSLPSGDYVVWEDADTAGPVVTVPEGAVAELRLP
jgi:hypothetical protein